MRPQRVQIMDLGRESDVLGADLAKGRPTTALRVVDEAARVRKAIEIGQEVLVIEVGSTVNHHDRRAPADVTTVQLDPVEPDASFAGGRVVG
jgi:hypothetical protein